MHSTKSLCRLGVLALTALAFVAGFCIPSATQQTTNKTDAWQVRAFGDFLDRHPDIAQDLNKNPNLVNDQGYVSKHPDLKQFLAQHPDLRKRLQENPAIFLQQTRTEEKSEAGPSKWQLRTFGEFLEQHPNIAQDLNKNPNLVNDQDYLSKHPELNQFLAQHSDLRERLQDHPAAFFQAERSAEKSEGGPNKWQLRTFGEFLEQHPNVAQDLNKNPNLVNDQNYLSKHPELNQFLAQHSDLRDQLADNPAAFIQQSRNMEKGEKRK